MPLAQESIYRSRVRRLLALSIEFVPNDAFRRQPSKADLAAILAAPCALDPSDSISSTIAGSTSAEVGDDPFGAALLTREQERELFRRMNLCKCRAAMLRVRLDAPREDPELLAHVEALIAAILQIRDHLVRANLRLVISIAKRYVASDVTLPELVSDGQVSLLQAIEKFDFSRGFRFSTYATWAIRYNLGRAARSRRRRSRVVQLIPEESLRETVAARRSDPQQASGRHNRVHAVLARILGQLDPREQNIVRCRFGLTDEDRPRTLQGLADEMGVCKERVRQLELRALRKLRGLAIAERLEQLTDELAELSR